MKDIFLKILIVSLIALFSCDKEEDEKTTDFIGLSSNSIEFSSKKDSTEITTNDVYWWFSSLHVQDEKYTVLFEDSIKGDWFQIIKTEDQKIKIVVDENDDDVERSFFLTIVSGNYAGYIEVLQK